MLITVSNLFPRPDQPNRGLYNYYLFRELAKTDRIQNICIVPSWKVWQWSTIRRWTVPDPTFPPTVYFPVPYLPWIGRSWNDWFYARALRHWSKTLKQGDLVYVPWLYPDGVAVARVMRSSGARLWLMALGSDTFHLKSPLRRRKILEACAQAEGIVCVAQALADRLAAAGVPRAKLHVVPNGVDTSLFRARERDELSSASKTILFVGNLVPVKCPELLLKAFAELGQNEVQVAADVPACNACGVDTAGRPAADGQGGREVVRRDVERHREVTLPHLQIIGSGPMRAQLEQLAHDLGIADRVQFLGRRPREEVALWMNRADVLCLSSRSEGMPNVVLEARASGLPVVTTPAGAIPELPLAGEHFLVVESCSAEALAGGFRQMLGRDLSRRKSDPAILSWGQMADKIRQLIGASGRY